MCTSVRGTGVRGAGVRGAGVCMPELHAFVHVYIYMYVCGQYS